MAIWKDAYAQTRYNLTPCANRKKLIDNIVVHYTGTSASAKNNCIYFGGGNRGASADFFIDKDGTIWKFNKSIYKYYSWHCGDGHGKYGITNARSIGIEVVSAGEEFTSAQKRALKKLIAWLRKDIKRAVPVVRHYDASRKVCPAPYAGSTKKDSKWAVLKKEISRDYVAQTDTNLYRKRNSAKKNRIRSIKRGEKVSVIATWQGKKYLWGTLADGTYVILDKFK